MTNKDLITKLESLEWEGAQEYVHAQLKLLLERAENRGRKAIADMRVPEIVDELKEHGWEGATTYARPKLVELLQACRAGKMREIPRPRRGRPPLKV